MKRSSAAHCGRIHDWNQIPMTSKVVHSGINSTNPPTLFELHVWFYRMMANIQKPTSWDDAVITELLGMQKWNPVAHADIRWSVVLLTVMLMLEFKKCTGFPCSYKSSFTFKPPSVARGRMSLTPIWLIVPNAFWNLPDGGVSEAASTEEDFCASVSYGSVGRELFPAISQGLTDGDR